MFIFHTTKDLTSYLLERKKEQKSMGYVPTMGALHEGHLQLIRAAKLENDICLCSIFVNPTQFNNPEDLLKYPRSIENDIKLLEENGCDILFMPDVAEVYPNGQQINNTYSLGDIEEKLEGAFRPGHFQGVAQVLDIFFSVINPETTYFGRKDYQQCLIVKKLIEDKFPHIEFKIQETLREPDGLALSSRNKRLTDPQRILSNIIYQCLISVKTKQEITSFSIIQKECIELLTNKCFNVEYFVLADAENLNPLNDFNQNVAMVVLVAAYLGNVRLIDNMPLN